MFSCNYLIVTLITDVLRRLAANEPSGLKGGMSSCLLIARAIANGILKACSQ